MPVTLHEPVLNTHHTPILSPSSCAFALTTKNKCLLSKIISCTVSFIALVDKHKMITSLKGLVNTTEIIMEISAPSKGKAIILKIPGECWDLMKKSDLLKKYFKDIFRTLLKTRKDWVPLSCCLINFHKKDFICKCLFSDTTVSKEGMIGSTGIKFVSKLKGKMQN